MILRLKNPLNPTTKTMTFDLYLDKEGSEVRKINGLNVRVLLDDSAILNSGVLSAAYTSGTELDRNSFVVTKGEDYIDIALASKPTNKANATLDVATGDGTKIGTFTLSNTADFTASSNPALDVDLDECRVSVYSDTEAVMTRDLRGDLTDFSKSVSATISLNPA